MAPPSLFPGTRDTPSPVRKWLHPPGGRQHPPEWGGGEAAPRELPCAEPLGCSTWAMSGPHRHSPPPVCWAVCVSGQQQGPQLCPAVTRRGGPQCGPHVGASTPALRGPAPCGAENIQGSASRCLGADLRGCRTRSAGSPGITGPPGPPLNSGVLPHPGAPLSRQLARE